MAVPADRQPRSAAAQTEHSGEPIIEVRGLVKRYGSLTAVNGVDLAVARGEIFGILGPNGAGKTTTLELIEGMRPPDAGSIQVAGINVVANPTAVRRVIGVQLQTTALFDDLSAAELIALFAALYDVDASRARVDHLLDLVGLGEKRQALAEELSGGQRQRLSIALALVNDPEVVFLDEPTTGLDPRARRDLWDTVRGIRAAGTTVVITTHYMEEAQTLCDRVAVMDRGEIIACDTPAALIRDLGQAATVRAAVTTGVLPAAALSALPALAAPAEHHDGMLTLHTTDVQATLVALLAAAGRHGATLHGLSVTEASLEDVFLRLTGRTYQDDE